MVNLIEHVVDHRHQLLLLDHIEASRDQLDNMLKPVLPDGSNVFGRNAGVDEVRVPSLGFFGSQVLGTGNGAGGIFGEFFIES